MIDNAFNYRQTDHMDTSEWAQNPANCTTLFNQWRLLRLKDKSTPDWPEFRNAKDNPPPARRGPKVAKKVPTTAKERELELIGFKPFVGAHGSPLQKVSL